LILSTSVPDTAGENAPKRKLRARAGVQSPENFLGFFTEEQRFRRPTGSLQLTTPAPVCKGKITIMHVWGATQFRAAGARAAE
jgi:hypothetical protein